MYVHAYQIDNVLNVYRKQLSQRTRAEVSKPASTGSAQDQVSLSPDSQRQSIFNQVSADIVRRIARYSQENRSQEPIEQTTYNAGGQVNTDEDKPVGSFSYTLIDEKNHKKTSMFQFNNGGPFITRSSDGVQEAAEEE